MVNRFTIGALMKLAKSIGANPNKFMGTKTNISFLGKGPTKNPLFQRPLPGLETASARSLGSRDALIEATEDAMGFATAGKLNSIQTQILGKNLSGIKNILEPPPLPMASITTLSRSGLKPRREWANLEQGSGIMSAKKTSDPFMGFKPKVVPKKASLAPAQQSFLKQLDEKILQTEEGFLTQADLNTMSPEVLDNLRRSVDPIGMQRMFGEITKFASGGLADIMQTPRRGRVTHPGGYAGKIGYRGATTDDYKTLAHNKGSTEDFRNLYKQGVKDIEEELLTNELIKILGGGIGGYKDGGLAKILEV
jgi:hypothetical protein